MPYVTASEYARAKGISRQAVHKQIRVGKLTAREDGRVFAEEDSTVGPTKAPATAAKKPKAAGMRKARSEERPRADEEDAPTAMAIIGSLPMNYDQARTARLMIQTRRDQIALAKQEGEFVSSAEIEAGIADRVAMLGSRWRLPVRFGRAQGLTDHQIRALEADLDEVRRDFVDGLKTLIDTPNGAGVDDDVAIA